MTVFVIAAALLLVLVLYAVLRPLLARSRSAAIAIGLATVTASVGLYLALGSPAALDPAMVRAPETLAEARAQLERKLQDSPADAEGWRLLGRAYTAENRPADAARAYAEAAQRAPRDADILTEAAEARALARDDHRFDDTAVAQLKQALAIDAHHERARWFLGISQRQSGQPAQAAETWAPLLGRIEEKTAATLLAQINEARREAGLPAIALPARAPVAGGVEVQVAMAPGMEVSKLPQSARVFVIARAVDGPPMPVAVRTLGLAELPATVTLSDADSPMPTVKISAMKQVEVLARLSMSGSADRGEDDLESTPQPLALPATQKPRLVIGRD